MLFSSISYSYRLPAGMDMIISCLEIALSAHRTINFKQELEAFYFHIGAFIITSWHRYDYDDKLEHVR